MLLADQEAFFWMTMCSAAVACFGANGLLCSGLTGLSAKFPHVYVRFIIVFFLAWESRYTDTR